MHALFLLYHCSLISIKKFRIVSPFLLDFFYPIYLTDRFMIKALVSIEALLPTVLFLINVKFFRESLHEYFIRKIVFCHLRKLL